MANRLEMGMIALNVDDELEQKFRKVIFERKGMKRGNISESLEEAIELWMDPRVTEIIKKRGADKRGTK